MPIVKINIYAAAKQTTVAVRGEIDLSVLDDGQILDQYADAARIALANDTNDVRQRVHTRPAEAKRHLDWRFRHFDDDQFAMVLTTIGEAVSKSDHSNSAEVDCPACGQEGLLPGQDPRL